MRIGHDHSSDGARGAITSKNEFKDKYEGIMKKPNKHQMRERRIRNKPGMMRWECRKRPDALPSADNNRVGCSLRTSRLKAAAREYHLSAAFQVHKLSRTN